MSVVSTVWGGLGFAFGATIGYLLARRSVSVAMLDAEMRELEALADQAHIIAAEASRRAQSSTLLAEANIRYMQGGVS